MNKYVVEFIGTFFLVFTIGNVVIEPGAGILAPLAIGAVLMALVFAGGHISGAHYNPAVTLAFYLRGKCDAKDIVPYVVAQVLAAAAAAGAVMVLKGNEAMVVVQPMDLSKTLPQALIAEFLFTFALVFVILNVATARGTEGNSFYGLAIGLTVVAGAYAVGGVSGGVFNPAVAVGISIMGITSWAHIVTYMLAQVIAAMTAVYVFKYANGPDEADAT